MSRRLAPALAAAGLLVALVVGLAPGSAIASPAHTPGAAGVGDPYLPLAGNGGYDVAEYDLRVAYDPATDVLRGTVSISATATQGLSRFNLDLHGMDVESVAVAGRPARWARSGDELTVTPSRGINPGSAFVTVVTYAGVPEPQDSVLGAGGFRATDDGALVAGQPQSAATWFPVNDHPTDRAAYTIAVTVPEGLEAIANGVLQETRDEGRTTTWVWRADEPLASYLTVLAIGEFDVAEYAADGVRYWDALDPDLSASPEPRTGTSYALTQVADGGASYQRLSHRIAVPAGGSELSFWVTRDTEAEYDFLAVEARPVGTDDWTMLPDEQGYATRDAPADCKAVLADHPFLEHYLTPLPGSATAGETCRARGTTGEWWAASGRSDGYEQWRMDLSPYAGRPVEVAITYVTDAVVQEDGAFVDDVTVSTGAGSTSFEEDGSPLDGWATPPAPPGSPANPGTWAVGTAADAPTSLGQRVEASLARQPEVLGFLAELAGPYPFLTAGGIVDDVEGLGFALETQTRPVYSREFFEDQRGGDAVVVHELAHQWFGNSLVVERWQHIWLNEGFATYAEWLWGEREGLGTAEEVFAQLAAIPAEDPFWELPIGDPGAEHLFDGAVYLRGAMTLHALRQEIGAGDFDRLVRTWAGTQAGGTVTTAEFTGLAERISGERLDEFFREWLFAGDKPAALDAPTARSTETAGDLVLRTWGKPWHGAR